MNTLSASVVSKEIRFRKKSKDKSKGDPDLDDELENFNLKNQISVWSPAWNENMSTRSACKSL